MRRKKGVFNSHFNGFARALLLQATGATTPPGFGSSRVRAERDPALSIAGK